MISIQAKILKVSGLGGTKDVTSSEDSFIRTLRNKLVESRAEGVCLSDILSEKQLDWLEDLHAKHFG